MMKNRIHASNGEMTNSWKEANVTSGYKRLRHNNAAIYMEPRTKTSQVNENQRKNSKLNTLMKKVFIKEFERKRTRSIWKCIKIYSGVLDSRMDKGLLRISLHLVSQKRRHELSRTKTLLRRPENNVYQSCRQLPRTYIERDLTAGQSRARQKYSRSSRFTRKLIIRRKTWRCCFGAYNNAI